MTDREKLTTVIKIFADDWIENERSIIIPANRTKIIWTRDGEIKAIIRNGKSFHPD